MNYLLGLDNSAECSSEL